MLNISTVSSIPGRIRFKTLYLYKNHKLCNKIKRNFYDYQGIKKVHINIHNMSLLIIYESEKLSGEKVEVITYQFISENIINKNSQRNNAPSSQKILKILPDNHQKDNYYQMSLTAIKKYFNTNFKEGLKESQAKNSLATRGTNDLKSDDNKSLLEIFLSQFNNFLIKVLLGTSVISLVLGHLADSISIIAIILVESSLGTWQNYKSTKALSALKKQSATKACVTRSGKTNTINSRYLVPGDIINLQRGDIVPADCRLITTNNLKIDESSLTGESQAVIKSAKINYPKAVPLTDRKNMLYMGTKIVKGNCKAIVVMTGMKSEIGNIASYIDDDEQNKTPLQKDLEKLAKKITFACIGISAVIMFTGILKGNPSLMMLRTGISLAIGAIPEGLTTILTISLAFGVQRMSKKGAIVKELPAVEILSCVDVICTDKTGTLTTGKMTVTDIHTLREEFQVTGNNYNPVGNFLHQGEKINPLTSKALDKILTTGLLCNNCTYENTTNSLGINGDPTDKALFIMALKAGLKSGVANKYSLEKVLSFDSQRKVMTVICKNIEDYLLVFCKGAPEKILSKSNKIIDYNCIRTISPEDKQAIKSKIKYMSNKALRVIGLAYKKITSTTCNYIIEEDLIFAGLVGIMDPPRKNIKQSLEKCRRAGIKTIMITGDHKNTAVAIARKIDLMQNSDLILTGKELDNLSEKELLSKINRVSVYARTSPEQKLRIVKALKTKGHMVAMTGDGINDSPAIKKSDIGIAMGKNGTEVTRQSSNIILVDDNFTTIVKAVEEGRSISNNVKKFMRYVLSGNIAEVITIFLSSIIGLPVPLIPAQILMINLVTEGIPALSLGVDPANENNMYAKPRNANKSIFDRKLKSKIFTRGIIMGFSSLALYSGTYFLTTNLNKARTLAYVNLVVNQMFHVFDCKGKSQNKNIYIYPSITISSIILLFTIYGPFSYLFKTTPLKIIDWLSILGLSIFSGRLDLFKKQLLPAKRDLNTDMIIDIKPEK